MTQEAICLVAAAWTWIQTRTTSCPDPVKMAAQGRSPASHPQPQHPTYDLDKVIKDALAEDLGDLGDITSLATIPKNVSAKAILIAKATGLLAGVKVASRVFQLVDDQISVEWLAEDGQEVEPGMLLAKVTGAAQSLLVAERLALNFLQRMSGIATATRRMVDAVSESSTVILDTRKTVPGLRVIDKWAVLLGGGMNHRIGLFDMMLIKDNHIATAGGISNAVRNAHDYMKEKGLKDIQIEVETSTIAEAKELIELVENWGPGCYVKRIMLDNMAKRIPGGVDTSMLKEAVECVQGKLETEASGNVALDTVKEIAATGVDYVSCGALSHSVIALDISMKIEIEQ